MEKAGVATVGKGFIQLTRWHNVSYCNPKITLVKITSITLIKQTIFSA